jgi:hypothetical protein
VFHIAERHVGLLPDDADARARAITWMFAALNTEADREHLRPTVLGSGRVGRRKDNRSGATRH